MTLRFTTEEIRAKYDGFARKYAVMEIPQELLGVRKLRSRMLRKAKGDVLEVAAGTGINLPHYPAGCRVTAVDISPAMLAISEERSRKLGIDAAFRVMDAEALEFPDESFDTVVSTLSVCTFPDPVSALREMSRVCRSDGRILLLEHGRSDRERLGRWQDRREDRHARQLGCHWNREPLHIARQAGLDVAHYRRTFLGVFQEIEARAPARET